MPSQKHKLFLLNVLCLIATAYGTYGYSGVAQAQQYGYSQGSYYSQSSYANPYSYSQSSYNTGNNPGNNNAPGYNYSQSSYANPYSYSQSSYSSGGSSNSGDSGSVWQTVQSVASAVWSAGAKTIEAAQTLFTAVQTPKPTYTLLPSGQYLSSEGVVTPTKAPITTTQPVTVPQNITDSIRQQQLQSGTITEVLTPLQKAILQEVKSELGVDISNPAIESAVLLATKDVSSPEAAIARLEKIMVATGGTISGGAIAGVFGQTCASTDCATAQALREASGISHPDAYANELRTQMLGVDARRQEATQDVLQNGTTRGLAANDALIDGKSAQQITDIWEYQANPFPGKIEDDKVTPTTKPVTTPTDPLSGKAEDDNVQSTSEAERIAEEKRTTEAYIEYGKSQEVSRQTEILTPLELQRQSEMYAVALTPTQEYVLYLAKEKYGLNTDDPLVETGILALTAGQEVAYADKRLASALANGANFKDALVKVALGTTCGDSTCRLADLMRAEAGLSPQELEYQMAGIASRKEQEALGKKGAGQNSLPSVTSLPPITPDEQKMMEDPLDYFAQEDAKSPYAYLFENKKVTPKVSNDNPYAYLFDKDRVTPTEISNGNSSVGDSTKVSSYTNAELQSIAYGTGSLTTPISREQAVSELEKRNTTPTPINLKQGGRDEKEAVVVDESGNVNAYTTDQLKDIAYGDDTKTGGTSEVGITRAQAWNELVIRRNANPDFSNYADENGQLLGESYSGPKGGNSLSPEAKKAAITSLGYKVSAVPATEKEIELMTRMVLAETSVIRYADGSINRDGVQAVAEVMRNRVLSEYFPDNVTEVIMEPGEFSPSATGKQWNNAYAPGSKDYAIAELYVRGVLDGTIPPIAVDDEGHGYLFYQNTDTVLGPNSEGSKDTKTSVAEMLLNASFTIFDASYNGFQHTFGTRYGALGVDLSPDDSKATVPDVFNTTEPSFLSSLRASRTGSAIMQVVNCGARFFGCVANALTNGNGTTGNTSNNNDNNSDSNNSNDPVVPPPPPRPASDLTTTALGAQPTGTSTHSTSSIEYKFSGSIARKIIYGEDGLPVSDIRANYADTLYSALSVDYFCDGTADTHAVFPLAYTAFDATEENSLVLISKYLPLTTQGTHCFFFETDIRNVVTEKDEQNNKSNVYRFIVGEGA